MKKRGFTLIELIAVLVILAILALIVTPLVLNIIRKARITADKRSIDAYGRSIELAVADYLIENGTFPTSIEELTIEYSGDTVSCSTTQLNDDSSVYLAGCTVGGRSVDYTYGTDKTPSIPTYEAYSIGDEVTYNEIQYYVIADSAASEESVTLIKAEPLTYEEVQTYSNGTGADTYNNNGIGGMQYHSSSSDYSTSYIKTAVDAWKAAKAPLASEARLITYEELIDNLGYDPTISSAGNPTVNENVPSFVYNSSYMYWTMTQHPNGASDVWGVGSDGSLYYDSVNNCDGAVRPVITILKSAL